MMYRNVTTTYSGFPIWHICIADLALCVGRGERESKKNVLRAALGLNLGFGWGKLPSLLLVLKSSRLVRAIAKRLVGGVSASAESDRGSSSEAICLTLHVDELDFPFDTQRAVIPNDDFG